MRRDPTLPLHLPEALELAEREGVDLVVEGGIGRAAGSLVLTARVLDPATREVTDALRVIAENEDDFINALGELSHQLTEVIGSGYSFRPRGPGLEQVTTASLEALRKYSLAQRVWAAEGDALQATALLREAVEIDPEFAMAYRRLAAILHATGVGRQERVLALRQAFLNSQRLPEAERLFTEGTYHLGATGDLDAAARAFRSLLVARPGDPQALNNLSLIYLYQADWAEAVSVGESCVEEETPAFPHCHLNLALAYFLSGEPGKADETLTEALTRFPSNPQLVLSQLQFAAARREWGKADSLSRVLEERGEPSPFWGGNAGLAVAQLHATRGRIQQAERKLAEVERLATEDSVAEDLIEALLVHAGLRLHVLGDTVGSVEIVRRAARHPLIFNLPPLEFPYHGLAEAFLLAGRFQEAGRLLDRFFREVPEENQGLFRGECLRLQALVALRTGQYEKAREDLDRARLGNAEPLAALQYFPLLEESQGHPEAALDAYLSFLESPQGNRLRYDAVVLGPYLERLVELQLTVGDSLSAAQTLHELESLWSEADPPLLDRVQSLGLRFHGSDFLIDLGPRLVFLLLS
jgi:tetratricopeptide (TPR) repeat protein